MPINEEAINENKENNQFPISNWMIKSALRIEDSNQEKYGSHASLFPEGLKEPHKFAAFVLLFFASWPTYAAEVVRNLVADSVNSFARKRNPD